MKCQKCNDTGVVVNWGAMFKTYRLCDCGAKPPGVAIPLAIVLTVAVLVTVAVAYLN